MDQRKYLFERRNKILLCAKTIVEKENQNIMPTCCEGGPLKSSFTRCSSNQITKPMKTKEQKLVNQSSQVNGFKNTHALSLLLSLIGTIIVTPESVNGNVKSMNCDLFDTIVVSPTTTSNFCSLVSSCSM